MTERRALGFELPLGLHEEATSPLFYLVIIQTDTQLGYKAPVCSAGVRGFAVFLLSFLTFFFFLQGQKNRDMAGKGVWANRCTTGPCLYIIHSFGCFSAAQLNLAAWVIMGDGRCSESKA